MASRGKRRSHADVDGGDEEGAGSGEQAAQTAATHLQRCRDATGEGRRVISWIWRGVDTSGSSASIYSGECNVCLLGFFLTYLTDHS